MTRSQGFQISQIPRLDGYVAIVTGGNAGVGFQTTLQLALHGARVYIASRSQTRVDEAITKMRESQPSLDIRFLQLDLQDLQSVQAASTEFLQKESRLDILINNAGIMACPYEVTKDGHEVQWQTCFLGHHGFTLGLLPLLLRTAQQDPGVKGRVRIVNVASDAAILMGPKSIHYEDTNMTHLCGSTAPWQRYGHSKQASIIAAKAINDRYEPYGITAYSLHPGIIKTNLQSSGPGILGALSRVGMNIFPTSTAEDGARTSLYCATSNEASIQGGSYIVPFGKVDHKADRWIEDPQAVQALWNLANDQLKRSGVNIEVPSH